MSTDEDLWWLLSPDLSSADTQARSHARSADESAPLLNPGIARLFALTQAPALPAAVQAVLDVPRWQVCAAPENLDLRAALAQSGAQQQLGKRAKRRLQQHLPSRLGHLQVSDDSTSESSLSLAEALAKLSGIEALVLHGLPAPIAFLSEQWPALLQQLHALAARQARQQALRSALQAVAARDPQAMADVRYVIRSKDWPVRGHFHAPRVLSVALSEYGDTISGADLLTRLAARDDYDQVNFNDTDDSHRERELPMVSWGPSVARTLLAGQSALDLEARCLGPVLKQLSDYGDVLLPGYLRWVAPHHRQWAERCLALMHTHAAAFQALCAEANGPIQRAQMHSSEGSRLLRHLERPLDLRWWQALARRAERVRRTRFVLGLY